MFADFDHVSHKVFEEELQESQAGQDASNPFGLEVA